MLDAFSRAVVTADTKTATIGGGELDALKKSSLTAISALMPSTVSPPTRAASSLILSLA